MSKSKLIEQAWTNSIGQVINPGDKVLVIVQGYNHSTYTKIGTFLGVNQRGQGTALVSARVFKRVDGKYDYHEVERRTTPHLQRIFALK